MTGLILKLTSVQVTELEQIIRNNLVPFEECMIESQCIVWLILDTLCERLKKSNKFTYPDTKRFRLSLMECYALHGFLRYVLHLDSELQKVLRIEIFTLIDKKL